MMGGADTLPLLLAYVGGMVMLLTPCRFPVVLAIVPLCKAGSPRRGVVLALIFGAGLVLTQSAWGVAVALVGEAFGLREVARYLSLVGAAVAYTLGLWALGLFRLRLPNFGSWFRPDPASFGSEYAKVFVMGLLLGNTGLCCPDPVFLSLVPFIAAGGVNDGAVLGAAYGLGRATPLVAIVMMARGGAEALQLTMRHKKMFDRATGWGLVAVGTFTLWGYSGIQYGAALAIALMVVPVLAFHLKAGSPALRTAAWVTASAASTVLALRVVPLVLVNLP